LHSDTKYLFWTKTYFESTVSTGNVNEGCEKKLLIQIAQVIPLGLIQHREDVSRGPMCDII